jgi:hypothetical protein
MRRCGHSRNNPYLTGLKTNRGKRRWQIEVAINLISATLENLQWNEILPEEQGVNAEVVEARRAPE